ncbi:aminotransferase class I/II-fold pyridoxal phosphate-dependent enzyme, partial [bacterium]|nr:aminotransferase class I/II-fold pyridoxal phosphate-dependent enzyme [bacterium]
INSKTKLIIINSPANPTGGVFTQQDIQDIADIVKNYNCYVMSDEIYSRIMYGSEHFSISSLPGMKERTIILDGFSKTYAMTGWRAGYGVMNKDLAAMVAKLMTNSNSCTNSFVQQACVEALQGSQSEVDKMVAEFQKRRDFIVDGLNQIKGFSCKKPLGAFYVFPNITKTGMESKKLADYLLSEAGVAALSGTAFGEYGQGYLRLSYANSIENIAKALERIDAAVKKL